MCSSSSSSGNTQHTAQQHLLICTLPLYTHMQRMASHSSLTHLCVCPECVCALCLWCACHTYTHNKTQHTQLAWPEHKVVHKQAAAAGVAWMYCTKRGKSRSSVMPAFDWTGSLRPERIGPTRQVSRGVVGVGVVVGWLGGQVYMYKGMLVCVCIGA